VADAGSTLPPESSHDTNTSTSRSLSRSYDVLVGEMILSVGADTSRSASGASLHPTCQTIRPRAGVAQGFQRQCAGVLLFPGEGCRRGSPRGATFTLRANATAAPSPRSRTPAGPPVASRRASRRLRTTSTRGPPVWGAPRTHTHQTPARLHHLVGHRPKSSATRRGVSPSRRARRPGCTPRQSGHHIRRRQRARRVHRRRLLSGRPDENRGRWRQPC